MWGRVAAARLWLGRVDQIRYRAWLAEVAGGRVVQL
jgi:hypothetical protein